MANDHSNKAMQRTFRKTFGASYDDDGSQSGETTSSMHRPRAFSQLVDAQSKSTRPRGRAATFNDAHSDSDASMSTTISQRRLPPAQRDQAAGLLNMRRGTTLYFGKDITTSMWWKYRQLHDGVGMLRGDRDIKPILENTYQLEPNSGHKFAPGKVRECVREVLACFFEKETYDPKKAAVLAAAISDAVKQRVKMIPVFDRYRFVVTVDIGSRVDGQEVVFASRYLWNEDTDGFATVTDMNRTMYVIVTVYGVYLD